MARADSQPSDPLHKALTHALGLWAFGLPLWVLVGTALGGGLAVDFHYAFLPAARAVLHGSSPYSAVGSRAVTEGMAFLYPPLAAYLFVPATFLPLVVADAILVVLIVAAVPATLWLLEIRDWRCYAVAFLWPPIIVGIQSGNLSLPMLLGLALVWRYRDRRVVVALVAGLVVALKLFFWPLLVWLVATRRYRTAAVASAASLLLVVVPWAAIGFAGLGAYPHLMATVSRIEGSRSYSLAAALLPVLPGWTMATVVETVTGAALLVLVLVVGRRGRDRDAFALSILAVLVLTPLLEMHYVAILLAVVALYRRRFGLAWAAPLLIWGAPGNNPSSSMQAVHVLAVIALTAGLAVTGWKPKRTPKWFNLAPPAPAPPRSSPASH